MPRSLAVVAYVVSALMAVLFAHHLIYYIGPIFARLHPIARALSGIVAFTSLPIVAYQCAVRKHDGTVRIAICSSCAWVALALTSPSVERDETWFVQGLVGDGSYEENAVTREIVCHCFADAEVAARVLFKDHKNWPKQYSESVFGVNASEVPETDVRLVQFSTTPSLDWINDLFGTDYGTKVYTTTLRFIDDHEDPLTLIETYRPEPNYDRYYYVP